jgi:steroid 5-alpha reductase family enzyme
LAGSPLGLGPSGGQMTLTQFVASAAAVALGLCAMMTAAWWIQQFSGKSGLVDTFWTFGVGGSAIVAALLPLSGRVSVRQIFVAALAAIWSLRLGNHIVRRNGLTGDDPRYRHMIEQWGADAARRMFWFLQSQAAVGVIFALAIAVAAHNPTPGLRWHDFMGTLIALVAISGEALADRELQRHRADPTNVGAVCDVGLWRWSRHPNYFFEWLFWFAFPVFAIDTSGHNSLGWFALAAPILMYWLLVHVSGIPPLEEHMERSRGAKFHAYQLRTSKFFPWPPRR